MEKNVTIKGARVHNLKNIDVTIPRDKLVVLSGLSGSGKSTLLNILGGLDSLSEGSVEVDGNSFADFSEADFDNYRNSYVGFVYQDFCLFEDLTVRENVRLALSISGVDDEERIERSDIPEALGKSYRKCIEDGDFDRVKKLKRVGIYSKLSVLLYKNQKK